MKEGQARQQIEYAREEIARLREQNSDLNRKIWGLVTLLRHLSNLEKLPRHQPHHDRSQ